MTTRLQGLETEYGFAILPSPPEPDLEPYALKLLDRLPKHIPCLPPTNGNGWFLANGARMYIDAGLHPEFATPEVDNPFDAVRYQLAGDRLLEEAAAHCSASAGGRWRMFLFKSNVDYLTGATWACHESYGHRMDPRRLPADLVPHLVSRIVYTGAGGLLPGGEAIQFCLSPRAAHLTTEVSRESTSSRGIFHLKDESLAGPDWHRLHVLAGESLCSHRAAVLKLGTTALVVALAEAGLKPGARVQLAHPLAALEAFNLDVEGRVTVPLHDGRCVTALDLQRHYLGLVQEHLEHPLMPAWAPRLCQLWAETLAQLERGPAAVAGLLDWGIKRSLHTEHLRQRGCEPGELERWNQATKAPPPSSPPPRAASFEAMLEAMAQHRASRGAQPLRDPEGFTPDQIRFYRQVRTELAELEIRFAQLGPGGVFRELDAQGLLSHRLEGELSEASVCDAMQTAPARGRAGVRGRLIRELAGQRLSCVCEWDGIHDRAGRFLDLSDPLRDEPPTWQAPRLEF